MSTNQRYHRQIILKQFGEYGQQRLLSSKVLVIGAGGLGCPVLQYLAGAGVGKIGIADHDLVSLDNLHRQPIYSSEDIGKPKAVIAALRMKLLNPSIDIVAYKERVVPATIEDLINGYDLVIDCSDNFPTRYLINDACVLLGKTYIYGAVSQFDGQLAVFNHQPIGAAERAVNYRDLFPQPPAAGTVLNCAEAGVLGVLPGIIGALQANEAIKILTGIGEPLTGRLLNYNALTNEFYEVFVSIHKDCMRFIPGSMEMLRNHNYEVECGFADSSSEIDPTELMSLLGKNGLLIDIREPGELPRMTEIEHIEIPMRELTTDALSDYRGNTIILCCQTGKRSLALAKELSGSIDKGKAVYSLKGGVNGLLALSKSANKSQ